MMEKFDLRSKHYWQQLGWGVLVGLLSAIGAFIFLGIMDWGISVVWPNPPSWEPFSGSWTIVIIMTIAGLIVGLIHKYSSAAQLDVFAAVDNGRLDPKPVPASLLASIVTLIGGFSMGPEVPTGMLAAGLGSWLSDKRKLDEETGRTNIISGVAGAYAGLFSSPAALLLIILESVHMQTVAYYGTLLIAGLAAAVGFSFFFLMNGNAFSDLLGLIEPAPYNLQVWHIGMGIILGILAVPIAILFGVILKVLGRLVAPLNNRPIVRGVLGGLLLGLLGKVLPITLFLGTADIDLVTEQAAEIGLGLLLVFALVKILALAGAMSFGFIGGPIFPLLFVGATVGSAINLVFPQIPLGLAVGCMLVGIPAAIVPIPFALAVIGILIVGLSPMDALPVILASLVAFSVAQGLGLHAGSEKEEAKTAA